VGHALLDIIAKVPPGTTPEQFQAMLRNLLADPANEQEPQTFHTLIPSASY
jgi:hypothetical protein